MGCMSRKGSAKICPFCHWEETPPGPSSLHLPLRTVLSGQYLIGRAMSEGKFSITYLGYDLKAHQKLAIKEYLPAHIVKRSADTRTLAIIEIKYENDYNFGLGKFIEESMALENQKHLPGLARTTTLFRENGTAYRVMDYIEGPSLEEYVEKKGGRLSFRETVRIMAPVMIALEKVYDSYLLHFDICPENIIVGSNSVGCLVNFTATRFELAQSWQTISSISRSGYSPVEFYSEEIPTGPWSDVYSLAATIYYVLTGLVPPQAPARKRKETLIPPSELDADISAETDAILMKALSLDPGGRYQSVKEFKESILESWYTRERKKPSIALDAFTRAKCPYCGTINEVLKTDLGSGTTACFACHHPLVSEEGKDLPVPPPAGEETAEKLPKQPRGTKRQKTREVISAQDAFTLVRCPGCGRENEVLIRDLDTLAHCTACGVLLSTLPQAAVSPPEVIEEKLPEVETAETPPATGAAGVPREAEITGTLPAPEENLPPESPVPEERGAGEEDIPSAPQEQVILAGDESEDMEILAEEPPPAADEEKPHVYSEEFFLQPEAEEPPAEPGQITSLPEDEALSEEPAEVSTSPGQESVEKPPRGPEKKVYPPEDEAVSEEPTDASTATGQESALEEIRRILYGEDGPDSPETEAPAAVDREEESPPFELPKKTAIEEPAEIKEDIETPKPEEKEEISAGPLTPLDCPICRTRNYFSIEEILSGVKCKKCAHQFFTEPAPEEVKESRATRRERLARMQKEARKFPGIWIISIVGIALLIGVFFLYQSQQSNKEESAAYEKYVSEGDRLFGEENYPAAKTNYQSALDYKPQENYLYSQIRKSDSLLAEQQKKENERNEQSLLAGQLNLADSLFAAGAYPAAKEAYEKALLASPDDSYILSRLAEIDNLLNPPPPSKVVSAPAKRIAVSPGENLLKLVEQADPGSVIKLGEGIYKLSAPLNIRKALELKGAGPNHTLIISDAGGAILDIVNSPDFKATGIGFEYQGQEHADLLRVKDSKITINNCLLRGAVYEEKSRKGGNAILFEGRSQGSVLNSRFHNNQIALNIRQTSKPAVSGNEIWSNYVGVQISESAQPALKGNRIRENFNNGVAILDQAQPLIESNQITDNRANGLFFFSNKFSGNIRDNQIFNNRDMGILLTNESLPTIEGNKIKWNGLGGIQFNDKASGIVRNNEIQGNKHGGIKITNAARPTVKNNQVKGNQGDGIEIMDKAAPTVEGNEITQNNGDGISLLLSAAGGFVSDNTCKGNQGYGISILKPARPSLVNNKLQGNFEGNMYEETPTEESQ